MCESSWLNWERTDETADLEGVRGVWNSACSGEMRRDAEEHRRRRRHSGTQLTLRRESMGSERD